MSEQNSQETNIPVNAEETAENVEEISQDTNNAETAENENVVEPEIVTDEEIAAEEAAKNAEQEAEVVENTEAAGENKSDAQPQEVDWKDSYYRIAAEFDNYRKRTAKEQDDVRRRERERVICTWLDVYDNAERALASMPEKEGPWYEGFASLIQQMEKCLATFNVKPADDLGQKFDSKRHDAIAACPNPGVENGTIIHVERRGFVDDKGNVVRVARVIVVRNPS